MNNDATAKIAMIEASLQCFVCGLIGLLPVIGLPFSILALWNAGRARTREKQCWNPAKAYRIWGVVCAVMGPIIWGFVATVFIYNATTGGDRDATAWGD